ncbi:MAG: glycosyltransferase family protein [Prevotella sp.]|jgi:hypothetical protein|nr:glycosyltransferase family protein [Prevotella sp.]
MISIIVSTYKPENFNTFSQNIEQTIGVEYEIIAIDNHRTMSLCEAYNKGIALAKYSYLCFSHDDIKINTYGWGNIIINQFEKNKGAGIIGVAGEGYKPWVPTGWFFSFISQSRRINITQSSPKTGKFNKVYSNPLKKELDNVIVIDGCWFCTTKEVTNKFCFDTDTFKGYHCYDIDFSLQVSREYEILISYNIDIDHYSYGNYSKEWIRETFKFHNKWEKVLPLSFKPITKHEIAENEFNAFCYILDETCKNNTHTWNVLKILNSVKLLQLTGVRKWLTLYWYTCSAILSNLFR